MSSDDSSSSPSLASRLRKCLSPSSSDSEISRDDGPPALPFRALFRYSTASDRVLMIIACLAAMVHGTLLPLFSVIFGAVIDAFGPSTSQNPEALESVTRLVGQQAKWFLILGAIAFVSSFIQIRFQLIFAQRVAKTLRSKFFRALLSQDHDWVDDTQGGELTTRVANDVGLIEAGLGDKVSSAVQFTTMFVAGFIIAFIYGWKLTLVILAIAPFLAISGALFGKLASDSTSEGLGAYGAAGAVANEAISLIRTVTAYNGQENEAKRYEQELDKAYKAGVMKAAFQGLALGFTYFVIFCTFAVAFSFGAWEVRKGNNTAGDVIVTFFSVFIATISIGQAAPAFNAFAVARGAAPRVYEVIERESKINPLDAEKGLIPGSLKGSVSFKNVSFNYSSRVVRDDDEETRPYVLDKFDLDIPAGSSHALVGSSGCGKSTTVKLIERFYDVDHGQVLIDDIDIREFNVRWLRSQIGYVGQMPTLFMLTIRQNIELGAAMEMVEGKDGIPTLQRKEVTYEDIVAAAKMANAHDFIMKLPEKYDTMLGERGALLSGGQKQRICIARALVRNPRLLLLDESTSALDAHSEAVVQQALQRAAAGRTTVTIAHRLSTVKNADMISVIKDGTVAESGTHKELMKISNGAYKTLVEYQNVESSTRGDGGSASLDGHVDQRPITENSASVSKSRHIEDETGESSDEDNDKKPDVDKGVLKRAFMMNSSELPFMLIGMVGSVIAGAAFPAVSILFASVINVLFQPDNAAEVRKWSLLYVLLGAVAFVGYFLHLGMLGLSGERLTRKLRGLAFRALLRQEIGFFDKKENSVGRLTTRLATEATAVQGITGGTLGGITMVISTLVTGFLIAFISCWRVALVVTVIFPLMGVSEAAQIKLLSGFDSDSSKKFAKAGAVASEAVDNFDTISSLGVQDKFIERYEHELEGPLRNGRRTAMVSGLTYGVAEFLAQALWAISFWVGSIFVRQGHCNFEELMKAISGLLFAGSALGQSSLFMPDFGKSRVAASDIFRLLDRQSEIDPTSGAGATRKIEGTVAASDVYFEYPTRQDVAVLRGLSLEVSPGKTIALVGESGCGKSTIVSLIERFYDPRTGSIAVDDVDASSYEVTGLRSQIGIVSQEPDLFNRSVADNIAYGLSQKDGTPVTESMIREAAEAANAHEFISELPDGYDTMVGVRGSKLSGGQRQRVAIARSLVRSPKVLLLDEATSALDSVAERVVQNALDNAATGRTTVTIAHRLSTVKDADIIAVVKDGKIVEQGGHEELLEKAGAYAALVKNQLSDKA